MHSLLAVIGATLAVAAGLAFWRFIHSPEPAAPKLSAPVMAGALGTSMGQRTFQLFIPANCPKDAALVLVLHGSGSSAAGMRKFTGHEFERLADEHGFIVAYPDGYRGYWNDGRKKGSFAAKKLGVDDVSFLRALVQHIREERSVGPVFAFGYSNGGHMCFRLALEAPDRIDAFAVVGANMPTDDNCICPLPTQPVPAMLVNGTSDPINPYGGGRVTIFGFGDRGTVRSAVESAEYFARLFAPGVQRAQAQVVVPPTSDHATWVERDQWVAASGNVVALLTVHGGGHVIPQPHYRFPRIIGHTEMRFNAPRECWTFFSRVVAQRTV
ncbi:MAG: alpha/beta fold hydrolase [bacterium]